LRVLFLGFTACGLACRHSHSIAILDFAYLSGQELLFFIEKSVLIDDRLYGIPYYIKDTGGEK